MRKMCSDRWKKRTFEGEHKEGTNIKRSQNILGNHRVWWWWSSFVQLPSLKWLFVFLWLSEKRCKSRVSPEYTNERVFGCCLNIYGTRNVLCPGKRYKMLLFFRSFSERFVWRRKMKGDNGLKETHIGEKKNKGNR